MRKKKLFYALAGGAAGAVLVKFLTRPTSAKFDPGLVMHSQASKFTSLSGIKVHYQTFGNTAGRPVLLLHGFSASTFVWSKVAPALAEFGNYVIAFDMPGFGYSDKPRNFSYKINAQAEIAIALLEKLGIERAGLIGSSYGGAVAIEAAAKFPQKIESLVLAAPVIDNSALSHPLLRLVSFRVIGELLAPFLADSHIFHRGRMKNTLAKSRRSLVTKGRVEAVRRPLAAADAHFSLLASIRNWDASEIIAKSEKIVQPTLIVWGKEDTRLLPESGRLLAEKIQKSRLVMLDDCGHLPMEEQPGLFIKLVKDFFVAINGQTVEG